MTADERDLLKNLRISLGISEKEHIRLEEEILKEAATTTDAKVVEIYNVALRQALADNRISADERAILQKIKRNFNIK